MSVYARHDPVVRLLMLAIALLAWLASGFGRLRSRRIVTLCYHGVRDAQRSSFHRQMRFIAHRVIDLPNGIRPRCTLLAPPRVCVTFDDAFANLLDNAIPIARDLRIPITIFAPTDCLGAAPTWRIAADHPEAAEPIMTAVQLRRIAGLDLCRVGSHGATHRALTGLPADETRDELIRSKADLERLTGRPVEDLAFPHGACDEDLIEAAHAAGYRHHFTLASTPRAHRGAVGIVARMSASPDMWPIEFRLTVEGAYDWLPPARRLIRAATRQIRRVIQGSSPAARPALDRRLTTTADRA
jgi:peptidoglycan/xylan/chitin deacetylase (PgdA/CDA1 family)